MSAQDPIFVDALSHVDSGMLAEGLAALMRERNTAFRIECNVATAHGRPQPDVYEFGITDILRLGRLLGS